MRKFVWVFLAIFLVSGCAALGTPPSVCESIAPGESLLCSLAAKNGMRLETIGNIIMFANVAAVDEVDYTSEDAVRLLNKIRTVIDYSVTGSDLVSLVRSAFKGNLKLAAAGVLVISPYISHLDTPEVLHPRDKDMLLYWVDEQIKLFK